MIAGDGFRWGNFYGSYSASEDFNGIGFELGIMDVPSVDNTKIARTFSIAIKISHFIFAVGWIFGER